MPRTTGARDRGPRATRGEFHHRTRYPDSLVEEVRQMRDRGLSYGQISRKAGLPLGTVRDWADYRTRT